MGDIPVSRKTLIARGNKVFIFQLPIRGYGVEKGVYFTPAKQLGGSSETLLENVLAGAMAPVSL
jgi:hypothetical protein